MSVRSSLLAILTIGPAYGFQLHNELASRTGHRRSVNVGQIYATLERLVKQGSVESAGRTVDGLPLYALTSAGSVEASLWLTGGEDGPQEDWDDLVDRVLIASSLPGVDVQAIIASTRRRWADEPASASDPALVAGQNRLAQLSRQALRVAVLGWLDDTLAVLTSEGPAAFHRDLSPLRPARGRRPTSQS